MIETTRAREPGLCADGTSHHPRLDELRRRVQQDPASIAFAALAEEYRRGGLFEQAIETCRAGLQRHPAYLSARVTLGRALLEMGQYEEGRQHLEQVLKVAPENLAAIRALADVHRRGGDGDSDGSVSREPARPDTIAAAPTVATAPPTSGAPPVLPQPSSPAQVSIAPNRMADVDPALARLDHFLGSIRRAREALAGQTFGRNSLTR